MESTPVWGVAIRKEATAPFDAFSFLRPMAVGMTPQEQSEVEAKAVANMEERLAETGQDIVADRFAKLSVWEIYQPIVKAVAKDYSLEVIFQD